MVATDGQGAAAPASTTQFPLQEGLETAGQWDLDPPSRTRLGQESARTDSLDGLEFAWSLRLCARLFLNQPSQLPDWGREVLQKPKPRLFLESRTGLGNSAHAHGGTIRVCVPDSTCLTG